MYSRKPRNCGPKYQQSPPQCTFIPPYSGTPKTRPSRLYDSLSRVLSVFASACARHLNACVIAPQYVDSRKDHSPVDAPFPMLNTSASKRYLPIIKKSSNQRFSQACFLFPFARASLPCVFGGFQIVLLYEDRFVDESDISSQENNDAWNLDGFFREPDQSRHRSTDTVQAIPVCAGAARQGLRGPGRVPGREHCA